MGIILCLAEHDTPYRPAPSKYIREGVCALNFHNTHRAWCPHRRSGGGGALHRFTTQTRTRRRRVHILLAYAQVLSLFCLTTPLTYCLPPNCVSVQPAAVTRPSTETRRARRARQARMVVGRRAGAAFNDHTRHTGTRTARWDVPMHTACSALPCRSLDACREHPATQPATQRRAPIDTRRPRRRQGSAQGQHGTAQRGRTHARAQVESSRTAIDAFNDEKKGKKKREIK